MDGSQILIRYALPSAQEVCPGLDRPCPLLPSPCLPQMLEETSQEEIDDLADQLQEAQDRVNDLEGQISVLQRQGGGR